jgi:hypothetical protein
MTASAAIDRHQKVDVSSTLSNAKASPIVVFRERCEARATLCANGLMTLAEAVDGLQADAERQGLVARYGQDSIQEVLAEAFGRWRLE